MLDQRAAVAAATEQLLEELGLVHGDRDLARAPRLGALVAAEGLERALDRGDGEDALPEHRGDVFATAVSGLG